MALEFCKHRLHSAVFSSRRHGLAVKFISLFVVKGLVGLVQFVFRVTNSCKRILV